MVIVERWRDFGDLVRRGGWENKNNKNFNFAPIKRVTGVSRTS
jgi:hypothetical protein